MSEGHETEDQRANILTLSKSRVDERLIDDPLETILGELGNPEVVLPLDETHDFLQKLQQCGEDDPLLKLTMLREIFERKRYYINEIDLHLD